MGTGDEGDEDEIVMDDDNWRVIAQAYWIDNPECDGGTDMSTSKEEWEQQWREVNYAVQERIAKALERIADAVTTMATTDRSPYTRLMRRLEGGE